MCSKMHKNGGKMKYIRGVVFSNTYAGSYSSDAAKTSLIEMKRQSACNTVVFVISAIQECAKESKIDYKHMYMPKDQDIVDIIGFAKEIGLQAILKPEIICMDGQSQTEIAKCHEGESEDGFWFQEYTQYIMHYAKVAAKVDCDMLIIGCELVELEKKERYWRDLICKIREVYPGYLTYNANRCKEENVIWWDALDYISANGFYKNNELPIQIQRIDEIQKKYNKPFFFSEIGCKSCEGASIEPGNWRRQGKVDLNEQANYLDQFLITCKTSENLSGMVVYNWWEDNKACSDIYSSDSYNIYGKPVCDVIKSNWQEEDKNDYI